jgi:hypothetical protein
MGVSYFTQERKAWEHRLTYHRFLREHASLDGNKRVLIPAAWFIALLWFFFAIGPGAVVGNTIFGDPNNPATWVLFGMPSIWAWQILWWALGVGMLWFLAYHMEMSVVPRKDVDAIVEDIGDREIV